MLSDCRVPNPRRSVIRDALRLARDYKRTTPELAMRHCWVAAYQETREALNEKVRRAERNAGWDPNS